MDPVRVPSIPGASFPLPPKLEGLRRLAYNLCWSWHPRTRGCSAASTGRAWARYRNPIAVISGPTGGRSSSRTPSSWRSTTSPGRVRRLHGQRLGPLVPAPHADELTGPIAYFCAEYGFHESLGIYSGGLGVLAGDHMKTASDMALPASASASCTARLLPPDDRRGRPPGARLSGLRPDPAARSGACWTPRRATDGERRAARPRPCRRGLGRPGRPRAGAAARHGHAGERRATGRSPTSCTSAAARCASTRSSSSASAASGRSGRSAWHRRSGTSTRATRRSSLRSVPASTSRPGRRSTTPGPTVRRDSVFTIHTPVSAGNERFDADLVRRVAGPLLEDGGVPGRAGARARARRRRRPRPVRHDGVLAPADERRERGQPPPRARRPTRPGRASSSSRSWASPTASTPRPGSASRSPSCSRTRRRSRRPRREHRGRPLLGAARTRSPAASCGTPTCARSASWRTSPEAGCAASSPATASRRRTWPSSRRARPGRADRRLRPALRHLQAGRPPVQRHRPAGADAVRRDAAGPDRVRRQGTPGRPARPAGDPGDLPALALAAARGRVYILENYDMRVARFLVQGVDVWLNNPRRPLEASGTSA